MLVQFFVVASWGLGHGSVQYLIGFGLLHHYCLLPSSTTLGGAATDLPILRSSSLFMMHIKLPNFEKLAKGKPASIVGT